VYWHNEMVENLKKCKLCKSEIRDKNLEEHQGKYSIICPKCFWRGMWANTVGGAIKNWNDENS